MIHRKDDDGRGRGEDLRVEELGDHASLHTWPELTANGRVLLNYGERESWSELSEVKPDGSGRRWPFWAKEHGLPGYGEWRRVPGWPVCICTFGACSSCAMCWIIFCVCFSSASRLVPISAHSAS